MMHSLDLIAQDAYSTHPHHNLKSFQFPEQERQAEQLKHTNLIEFQDKSTSAFEPAELRAAQEASLQLFCDATDNQHRLHHQQQQQPRLDATTADLDNGSLEQTNGQLNDGTHEQDDYLGQLMVDKRTGRLDEHSDGCVEDTETPADELANDDEEFIAFCTDASSVLNNDPDKRYHCNRLYQPPNAQRCTSNHDDEHLLYEEIQSLEATAKELPGGRRRVQLTKILEDDDGDDEQLGGDHQREDPLDGLQLTNLIDEFESFSPSSLVADFHDKDQLLSEVCADQIHQEHPDSTVLTSHISPTGHGVSHSSRLSADYTTNQMDLQQQHHHHEHHHHHQHRLHEQQQLQYHEQQQQHSYEQDPHYLSISQSDTTMEAEASQRHLNEHENHHQRLVQECNQQADNSSEISYFQQVSSTHSTEVGADDMIARAMTFERSDFSPPTSRLDVTKPECSNSATIEKPISAPMKQTTITTNTNIESKTGKHKTRTKRKRSPVEPDESSAKSVRLTSGCSPTVSSSIPTTLKRENDQTKTNEKHQVEHINDYIMADNRSVVDLASEADCSMDDEATSSAGGSSSGRRPMSKYRRYTANERERIRMREINQAFERLKKVVPIELLQQQQQQLQQQQQSSMSGDESDQTTASSRRGGGRQSARGTESAKLTKITTLRLAVSYISKLSDLLSRHTESGNSDAADRVGSGGHLAKLIASKGSKHNEDPKVATNGRKRRSRSGSSRRRPANEASKFGQSALRNKTSDPTKVLSADQRNSPILVAHNVLTNGMQHQPSAQSTSLAPVQNPNEKNGNQIAFAPRANQQQQLQLQPAQQQTYTISQSNGNSNNQERTFVTPVAVAILGIQTNGNQGSNEPQTLQILGIQGAQHQHQHQLQQLQQQRIQHHPTSQFNMIAQQPQQVTLKLDDINGLSVLRLANSGAPMSGTQTSQLQSGRAIVQQAQVLTSPAGAAHTAYSYYQPVQIAQMQSGNLIPTSSGSGQQQQQVATMQFASSQGAFVSHQLAQQTPQLIADHQLGLNIQQTAATTTASTITGTNSDRCNLTISQPLQQQQQPLSGRSANRKVHEEDKLAQTTPMHQQQASCFSGGQIQVPANLVTVGPNGQLFRAAQMGQNSEQSGNQQQPLRANLIYINPPTSSLPSEQHDQSKMLQTFQHQQQHLQLQTSRMQPIVGQYQQVNPLGQRVADQHLAATGTDVNGLQSSTKGPFELVKFVAQFSAQTSNQLEAKSAQTNAADIQQLVASLTTSLHPSSSAGSDHRAPDGGEQHRPSGDSSQTSLKQQPPQQHQPQQQQPKRTYRFHNYDGNMITNQLYGGNNGANSTSSTDQSKQGQQQSRNVRGHQQQSGRRNQQQAQAKSTSLEQTSSQLASQRSRQNSLSSTCSTTSSSSSSLNSSRLSSASPTGSTMTSIRLKSTTLPSAGGSVDLDVNGSSVAGNSSCGHQALPTATTTSQTTSAPPRLSAKTSATGETELSG